MLSLTLYHVHYLKQKRSKFITRRKKTHFQNCTHMHKMSGNEGKMKPFTNTAEMQKIDRQTDRHIHMRKCIFYE